MPKRGASPRRSSGQAPGPGAGGAAAARGRVKAAVLLGRDAALLAGVLAPICPVTQVGSMADAVAAARQLARAGDTVLLSPACASLDMYEDFAARGDDFRAAVLEVAS